MRQVSCLSSLLLLSESLVSRFSIDFAHKRMYISLFTKNCALTTGDAAFSNNAQRSDVQQDVIYYQRRFYHSHNDKYINLAGNAATKDMGQQKKKTCDFKLKQVWKKSTG